MLNLTITDAHFVVKMGPENRYKNTIILYVQGKNVSGVIAIGSSLVGQLKW